MIVDVVGEKRQGRAVLALVAVPATGEQDRSAVAGVEEDDLAMTWNSSADIGITRCRSVLELVKNDLGVSAVA